MDMTSRLTAVFDPKQIPELYSDWNWLIDSKFLNKPLLMSCFGDLFFEGPEGNIHFVDTLEGTITQFADNENDARNKLAEPAVQKRFLTSETVELLEEKGLSLKQDELYIYVPHPIIAGAVVIDSIQIMSMKVALSLGGQLLRQVGRR